MHKATQIHFITVETTETQGKEKLNLNCGVQQNAVVASGKNYGTYEKFIS